MASSSTAMPARMDSEQLLVRRGFRGSYRWAFTPAKFRVEPTILDLLSSEYAGIEFRRSGDIRERGSASAPRDRAHGRGGVREAPAMGLVDERDTTATTHAMKHIAGASEGII